VKLGRSIKSTLAVLALAALAVACQPSSGGSSLGDIAVSSARSRIGAPYCYGGAGGCFDCSGLTMYAWGQAGVWLPHNDAEQWNVVAHVSSADMRPGDLIFWYGHVAIYSGNGWMIEAAHPGTNVREVPVRWDFYGVGRPG
jgi:cell wall-associated NlpC family hydrolase